MMRMSKKREEEAGEYQMRLSEGGDGVAGEGRDWGKDKRK